MLIRFCVTNWLSFDAQQCLAYTAAADRSLQSSHCIDTGYHAIPRINRSAILFGASGSGKTNYLLALRSLQALMRHSHAYSTDEFAAHHRPFRHASPTGSPTGFDIDLLIDGVRYRYTIAYDSQRIVFERLLVYQGRKSRRWFERRIEPATQRETWAPFSSYLIGPREIWRRSTPPRIPFVVVAAKLNARQFEPLIRWFDTQMEFFLDFTDQLEFEALIGRLQDAAFRAHVLGVLRAVGMPVRDIRASARIPTQTLDFAGARPRAPYGQASATIELQHEYPGEEPVWMPLSGEAAGTQRLISLLRPLFDCIKDGRLVVIDNFDAAMHPIVTRFLLQLMNSLPSGAQQPQLLLTSHNIALMDLSILRRDEIWLVDLDGHYASRLSCLGGFGVRRGEAVGKHYIKGRYGAIPHITN